MIFINLLSLSIGIGLAVSLLFSELFGLAAGGLVVPGYIALSLNQPIDVALTLLAALATFFLVRLASSFVIIYGRRRTVMMILIGYLAGAGVNGLAAAGIEVAPSGEEETAIVAEAPAAGEPALMGTTTHPIFLELGIIGFIIPGLIAIWLDRQGVVTTLSALITSAVVVRLLLILIVPSDLQWYESQQPAALSVWFEAMTR